MSVSSRLRFEVFKRDNFTCQYCGRKTPLVILECDHIHPVCKGGTDDFENLTTSCYECNRGKSGNLLEHVLQNKDLHEEAIVIAEREMQIAEYNAILNKRKKREAKEAGIVLEKYREVTNGQDYKCKAFLLSAIRQVGYHEIIDLLDHIEYKFSTLCGSRRGELCGKYFSGCLRTIITGSKGVVDGEDS